MKNILLFLFFSIMYSQAQAQLSFGGKPPSFFREYELSPPATFVFDPVDNQMLIDTELPVDDTTVYPPYVFAKNYPLNITTSNFGSWETLPTGKMVWRAKISSPTSLHSALIFKQFDIPEGAELFFYDENSEQLCGAYTSSNNAPDGIFVSPFIKGNTIIIEYVNPIDAELPVFEITDFIHAYRDLPGFSVYGSSLPCHNNVVCNNYNDYCNQIRSVCVIMVPWTYTWSNCNTTNIETRWKGGSGALINNSYNNFAQYLLTARHVIWEQLQRHWCLLSYSTQSGYVDLSKSLIYFNYQSRRCDPEIDLSNDYAQRMRGISVVSTTGAFPGPDMALLKINDPIPIQYNVFYSGWNRQSKGDLPTTDVAGIHHPSLDVKKISKGHFHWAIQYQSFWGVDWYSGVTEHGSSGSPLFCEADKRIIGTCSWGTNEDCDDFNQQDRYGRVIDAWASLYNKLSPDNPNREVFDGADPATYCQNHIDINGQMMACGVYNENRPSMTIQAASTINFANLGSGATYLQNEIGFRAKYNVRAGNSIEIAATSNRSFEAPLNTYLLLEIQPCNSTTGCEIDFNTQNKNSTSKENQDNPITNFAEQSEAFKVYPNPASSKITVEFKEGENLIVTDILGRIVYKETLEHEKLKTEINVSNWPDGTYFVTICNSKTKYGMKKVVIQK